MNALAEAIGELCRIILPIPDEYYVGNSSSSIAICTLSSMDLLKKFHNSKILDDDLLQDDFFLKIKELIQSLNTCTKIIILLQL